MKGLSPWGYVEGARKQIGPKLEMLSLWIHASRKALQAGDIAQATRLLVNADKDALDAGVSFDLLFKLAEDKYEITKTFVAGDWLPALRRLAEDPTAQVAMPKLNRRQRKALARVLEAQRAEEKPLPTPEEVRQLLRDRGIKLSGDYPGES